MRTDRPIALRDRRHPGTASGGSLLPVLMLALIFTLALASVPSAAAQDPRVPLTPAEVTCNQGQLLDLVRRMEVSDLEGNLPGVVQSLFVSYSNRHGFYDGMVVGMPRFRSTAEPPIPGFGPGPEHQFGFHLNPSVRELLLNPERTPLAQVSLTRETSTSNLVTVLLGNLNPFAVVLAVNPTLGGHGAGDLVIDNLGVPPADPTLVGFRPADTKPGRGLSEAGLTTLCHDRLTDLDRRVFSILQRTLRADLLDPVLGLRYDTRITLGRGEAPDEYIATISPVNPETGRLRPFIQVHIRVGTDGAGRLTDGHLDVSVPELADYPVLGEVAIVRPLFGGVDSEYVPEVAYPIGTPVPAAPSTFWDFDWRDVLADTAWNEGAAALRECGQGTAEEIAATPREDTNRELLAIGLAGGLTADQEVYDRLGRDLEAIRAMTPAVENVQYLTTNEGKRLYVMADSAATYASMKQGTYQEWDCLNDWYGLEEIIADAPFPATDPWVIVRLKGIYDLLRIAPEYEVLPGIASASPVVAGFPAILLSSLCVTRDGATYHYFFEVAGGDAFTTFYFTTEAGGSVELVGIYDPRSLGPSPPPGWLTLRDQCRVELGLEPVPS